MKYIEVLASGKRIAAASVPMIRPTRCSKKVAGITAELMLPNQATVEPKREPEDRGAANEL